MKKYAAPAAIEQARPQTPSPKIPLMPVGCLPTCGISYSYYHAENCNPAAAEPAPERTPPTYEELAEVWESLKDIDIVARNPKLTTWSLSGVIRDLALPAAAFVWMRQRQKAEQSTLHEGSVYEPLPFARHYEPEAARAMAVPETAAQQEWADLDRLEAFLDSGECDLPNDKTNWYMTIKTLITRARQAEPAPTPSRLSDADVLDYAAWKFAKDNLELSQFTAISDFKAYTLKRWRAEASALGVKGE